jgi:phosphatidylglycerophosphate synthase
VAERRSPARSVLFVVVFALVHVAVTMWAGISALGTTMAGFEPGMESSPRAEWFFGGLAKILSFPLVWVRWLALPGLWGYLVFFANGLLWGAVILTFWTLIDRLRARRRIEVPESWRA